jgi:hypothetical protein
VTGQIKAAKTVQPAMARPLLSLGRAMSRPAGRLMVVHRASATAPATRVLAPGVEALDIRGLVNALAGQRERTRKSRAR